MRVLVCSFASPGFLFPLLGIAHELRRRGHDVLVAAGAEATGVLAAEAFVRVPRGSSDGPSFDVARWADPLANAIDIKHIEHGIDTVGPDALLTHHLCLSALVSAGRRNLPVAVLGPFSFLYPPADPYPVTVLNGHGDRLRWRLGEMLTHLNRVRALCRLPPVEATPQSPELLGDLFMLRSTPLVERGLACLPDRVHVVGACGWEPASALPGGGPGTDQEIEDAVRDASDAGTPIVYVHNGRAFNGPSFWTPLLEGVTDAPIRLFASVGRMDAAVGRLPKNMMARDHMAQARVLPHASAVVAGGHTTVALGAAEHGVPSVFLPFGVDTPDNAARLEAAGAAICLDVERTTPSDLRDAVMRAVQDTTMRRRCDTVRRSFAELSGAGAAASLVEHMAVCGGPVLRGSPAATVAAQSPGGMPERCQVL